METKNYSSYMNDIERSEYTKLFPVSKLHMNDPYLESNKFL